MRLFLFIISIFILSSCAQDVSPNSYSVGSVGEINRVVSGVIVSVREVNIRGTSSVGSASGVAAGAVAGSALGGGVRGNIFGAIGGAVIGGIAGSAIESSSTAQSGIEYIVQTDNGNMMTIVQGGYQLYVGDKVFVLYGSPSRLIKDTRK